MPSKQSITQIKQVINTKAKEVTIMELVAGICKGFVNRRQTKFINYSLNGESFSDVKPFTKLYFFYVL